MRVSDSNYRISVLAGVWVFVSRTLFQNLDNVPSLMLQTYWEKGMGVIQ
jgi:hypothetical protein